MGDSPATAAARALGRARWKGTTKAERVQFARQIAAQGAGRPSIATDCPKCGETQPSARAARAHCRN